MHIIAAKAVAFAEAMTPEFRTYAQAVKDNARALAAALQEMGPSFIKLGQALSTRADLLSEQVAADLAKLQDHLPAFPGAEARRIIEAELGQLHGGGQARQPAAHAVAQLYHERFTAAGELYRACQRDLVSAFARFQQLGLIEIITCAATFASGTPVAFDRYGTVREARGLTSST